MSRDTQSSRFDWRTRHGQASVTGRAKVKKVMGEFKRGKLRSGSKKGPKVQDRNQAIAIALSEARKNG